MKTLKIATIALSSLILLTACSQKRELIPSKCPSIRPVGRIADINVTTNKEGGLDHNETIKVFNLIHKLRKKEKYQDTEINRLWELNNG